MEFGWHIKQALIRDGVLNEDGTLKMPTPVKLITADGLEYTIPNSAYNKNIKNIVRNVTDGSKILGQRHYELDKYRDGEYREVVVDSKATKPKASSKKQNTPATIKELLKAYSLQELIAMKLEDVEFKGISHGK
jgi:hypothetical protein